MRRRSGTGLSSRRATYSLKKDRGGRDVGKVVNKLTMSSRRPGQQGQHGDETNRRQWRRTYIQWKDVVAEGKHDTGGGGREVGAGQLGRSHLAVLYLGG
jgi:hypothetical protein